MNFSVGVDGISVQMLKGLDDFVIPSLESIINLSLCTSIVPKSWAEVYVTPVPKVVHPKQLADCRPINISCAGSKILEKVVYRQAVDHLVNNNNLLDKFQSGFRPAHNTTTALLHITDEIEEGMDNGSLTLLVLLDFTKAFDSIIHEILFEKLRLFGFSPHSV